MNKLKTILSNPVVGFDDTIFWATFYQPYISPLPQTLVFDWSILNSSNHYNNATGFYTAPVDGIYEFNVQLRSRDDVSVGLFSFFVNGDDRTYTQGANDADYAYHDASSTALLELVAGWTVSVRPYQMGSLEGFASTSRSWVFWKTYQCLLKHDFIYLVN